MSNKSFTKMLFLFCLIIILAGCNKKNQQNIKCLSFIKAPVTKIEGANSASVNQEITLIVSFGCYNGCGQFGDFEEINAGNTTTIKINAKYEGCICTDVAPILQTTYQFKKSQAGTYDLKFLQTENTFLTHSIIVQ